MKCAKSHVADEIHQGVDEVILIDFLGRLLFHFLGAFAGLNLLQDPHTTFWLDYLTEQLAQLTEASVLFFKLRIGR